ncbi:MAG: AraC family transcriptional regulator [Frankiaceae bacterium]|nr:AraC family transcriptional regulator [Frankiaceae bacterium]
MPRTANGLLVLLDLGSENGVAAETALRGTGLNVDLVRYADAEVTPRQEAMVVSNLLDALPQAEGLGLQAGLRYHLTTYGIWGFALISSPTLQSAIEVGLQYLDLTFAFSRIRTRLVDDELQFVLDTPGVPTDIQRFTIEREAANIQVLQREVFAAPIPIQRVAFAFPAPADVEPYLETFGVVPQFDAVENVIAFDPTLLDAPLPQANANTAAFAQAQCRELLERRQARVGLSGQVRDLILARPSNPPDAEQVSQALHLSSRTLRERLAAEGTSFRALLDEVRERLAEEMLIVGGLTVAQTAERLGYVELSSFSQAFRRWKGMGPRDYRAQRLAVGR